MAYNRQVAGFLRRRYLTMHLKAVVQYHSIQEPPERDLPAKWYDKAYPKMTKLATLLKNVDEVDGRLINIEDSSSIITDEFVEHRMHTYKSLVRAFIGSPAVQQKLKKILTNESTVGKNYRPHVCFGHSSERQPMILNTLTQVSDFLSISAQQRKLVRQAISPQVTQYRIWTGALLEILNGLKHDLDFFNDQYPTGSTKMGQQIVASCLKFLDDPAAVSAYLESSSWMKPVAFKSAEPSSDPSKWGDALAMFNDLIRCLRSENEFLLHVQKLEAMKEGLSQIKEVMIDRSVGYKDVRHQEILVQKKLTKALSHSSTCFFTLLLYYLYGRVQDIEVDVCGGIHGDSDGGRVCLYMGRILTTDEESVFWRGVKGLDRVLRVMKFVWESAEKKGVLELQGHLWCVGVEDKVLTYRGNTFFLHGIK